MTSAPRPVPPGGGVLEPGPDRHRRVRFRRALAHPLDRVWTAVAEPERQAVWVPGLSAADRARGTVAPGNVDGVVLTADPPHVLEQAWLWPGEPPSVVRWELADDGDGGTVLTLLHHPVRAGTAAGWAAGWHLMLDALGVHLDGGDGTVVTTDPTRLRAAYAAEWTAGGDT